MVIEKNKKSSENSKIKNSYLNEDNYNEEIIRYMDEKKK